MYTQIFNKRHKRDGSLFRGRYKALVVDSNEYLTELVRYIHQNPVKARLCNVPEKHRWTSHKYYLKSHKDFDWLKTMPLLQEYGRHISMARRRFDELVKSKQSDDVVIDIERHQNAIIGNRSFKEWVNANFVERCKREEAEFSQKEKKLKPEITAKTILSNVAFCYGIKTKVLQTGQSGIKNEARSLAIYILRQRKGYGFKKIAKWLKAKNSNAIAQRFFKSPRGGFIPRLLRRSILMFCF